jgi:nitrite reductase/ring-hydroxylating ferredoxin subunit
MAKPVQISHGDFHVVVVRIGDDFHAMNDVCPHRGAFIGSGPLDGTVLTCPWHDWSFDVTTGECLTNPNACQTKFPVSVDEGIVHLSLPD